MTPYFTVIRQDKRTAQIDVYDGAYELDEKNYPMSEQLIIMYKYSIYEEFIDWSDLSESMSQEEFNKSFDSGDRIFVLETDYHQFVVTIQELF